MATQSMFQENCILSTGPLRYWESGPTQAPVVLLLHSAFADAAFSWSPIWEALAAKYRVIAPDICPALAPRGPLTG